MTYAWWSKVLVIFSCSQGYLVGWRLEFPRVRKQDPAVLFFFLFHFGDAIFILLSVAKKKKKIDDRKTPSSN